MEAEHLHRPQQPAQAAAGQASAAVQLERIGQHLEVGTQGVRAAVGRRAADFVADRLDLVEHAGGGGEAGVDAGEGAAIGLVGALRRKVSGMFGQRQNAA